MKTGVNSVAALILAAGASVRMGRTKPLLDLGGRPLLERVMQKVGRFSFREVVAVIGCDAESIRRHIAFSDKRFRWVVNRGYKQGQSLSLQRGMEAVKSHHVMVFLGDQPFIMEETIHTVYDEGVRQGEARQRPFVVRPHFRSVPGHPVFFGHVQQMDFTGLGGDQGAKRLIDDMDDVYALPVDDCMILFDIDTPRDYERASRMWRSENRLP